LALFALAIAAIAFAVAVKKFKADESKADEDRVAKAWDVVSRMAGKQSNGGQVSALERLNSFRISLEFIDLHGTFLKGAHLHGAKLQKSNLSGANFEGADLSGADLSEANLSGVNLIGANLAGANMWGTDFRNAKLAFTKVDLAIVLASTLQDADLTGASIVFEDSEGGEIWDSFSDSLAEARDLAEMQALFNSACANPRFATAMNPLLEVKSPRRRCKIEPDYVLLLERHPRVPGGLTIDEMLNRKPSVRQVAPAAKP
jgi:hypothetical protein